MNQTFAITQPELLTFSDGARSWRGGDQDWFEDPWQRKAGCGATTAANLLSYLAEVRPGWEQLYPSHSRRKEYFLSFMNVMWSRVTPGKLGVNTTHIFTRGITEYAREHNVTLESRDLDIPPLRSARPTIDQCAAFLRFALSINSPVAFLNLSRGRVPRLESWHWVTIIALEEQSEGPLLCTVVDNGREFTLDFRIWFQSTLAGGGLVSVTGG